MKKLQRIINWYFSGSIVGAREYLEDYRSAINVLKETGKVLSEHVGYGCERSSGVQVNVALRDNAWVDSANGLIIHLGDATTGGGAEAARKIIANGHVLGLQPKNAKVSTYMTDWVQSKTAPNFSIVVYENKEQLENIVREFASKVLQQHPPLAGAYIVLEGGDGSGKTTQRWQLIKHLREQGYDVEEAREPGGTVRAESIRTILQDTEFEKSDKLDSFSELFLFEAARSQLFARKIIPALERGAIFASDRCFWSTIAYQGFGRGMNISTIDVLNNIATKSIKPDYGIIIDVPPEVGLAKITKVEFGKADRFEQEKIDFHHRVLEGYRFVAAREPNTVLLQYVDGIENMQATIREKVDDFLKENFKEV
ncbi:MAG: dTMP kinase [Candidatus Aenigmarchaeota archaeon]|nr:dTMP kinase [Candidatus Aenigmarchaeota archaeon]